MALGWFANELAVFADEGGLRCVIEDVARYVPFASIENALLTPALLGRASLWITTTDGDSFDVSVPSHVDESTIVEVILERSARARATRISAALRRGDLATWIATVAASHLAHQSGDAYRAHAMDTELLEQTLADATDEIEARAAAAYALMKVGRRDAVAPLVGALSPPMVIAAVRLAKGGETVVSDELLEQALPFLELRDRVVFQQRSRDAVRPNGSPKGTGAV